MAHELGHRKTAVERALSKLLLLPSLYMHFYIEHNFSHHLNAATTEDPATEKYNQTVYSFWITSVIRQYQCLELTIKAVAQREYSLLVG